jgi:hypothetical protein
MTQKPPQQHPPSTQQGRSTRNSQHRKSRFWLVNQKTPRPAGPRDNSCADARQSDAQESC